MTKRITHVLSPLGGAEFSFCGLAFDGFASGDHDTDDFFKEPQPGLRVTCPNCCHAITEFRQAFKGLRLTGEREIAE